MVILKFIHVRIYCAHYKPLGKDLPDFHKESKNKHIKLSCCTYEAFKIVVGNYRNLDN